MPKTLDFANLLMAAMLDAAVEGALTQLQTSVTLPGGRVRVVRVVVIPEEMDYAASPDGKIARMG